MAVSKRRLIKLLLIYLIYFILITAMLNKSLENKAYEPMPGMLEETL